MDLNIEYKERIARPSDYRIRTASLLDATLIPTSSYLPCYDQKESYSRRTTRPCQT